MKKFSPLDLESEQVNSLISSGFASVPVRKGAFIGRRYWVREDFWCDNDTCDHDYCGGCDAGSLLDCGEGYASIQYCATPESENLPNLKDSQTIEPADPDDRNYMGNWWLSPNTDSDSNDIEELEKTGVWYFMRGGWSGRGFFTRHSRQEMPYWASRISVSVCSVTEDSMVIRLVNLKKAKNE